MSDAEYTAAMKLHRRVDFYVKESDKFLKASGLYFDTTQVLAYASLLATIDLKNWLEQKDE